MKKIIDKIIFQLEKIVDMMIPITEKTIDKMILSKINEKGLYIAHMITSVLSKVFLIYLLFGVIHHFYIFIRNTFVWKNYEFAPYYFLFTLVISLILPILMDVVRYILMRLISVLIGNKLKVDANLESILFGTGFYLILMQSMSILYIVQSLINVTYQMFWNPGRDVFSFLSPLTNFIITIVYIVIGLKYIKKSQYLKDQLLTGSSDLS